MIEEVVRRRRQFTPQNHNNGIKVEFDKYVQTLLSSGLVRKIAAPEGTSYEITQAGSRLLEECENMGINLEEPTSKAGQVEVDKILRHIIKDQVTVVVPVLNEAEGIARVLKELEEEGYRNVLVIEGYSRDETAEKAHQNGVKVIYQHGLGKAGAVSTAIEHVQTPYMLFMDGDYTYDPKDIWRLLNHTDHYAHVIGARQKLHIPRLHRLGNWVISQVFSMLFGMKVSDVCSGMYLIETNEARKNKLQEPGFVVEIELAAISASNETLTEVPISYRPRLGKGKLSAWNGFAILSSAFTLASRYNPVLLYSGLAGLSIIPASIILGWVALQRLTTGTWLLDWALLGVTLALVAAQAFTLATVSILTKHSEERLMHELKRARAASSSSQALGQQP
jgi:GTP:adenosylcobinamide-phosphate guanylyltransferase